MKRPLPFLLMALPVTAIAGFNHESELSSVVTGGNSDVETYNYKFDNRYNSEIHFFSLNGHYTYGETSGEVAVRDWHANVKGDRLVTEKMAVYFGELVEGYRFQGIKNRYNTDIGLKWYFRKSDMYNIFSEVGYRYTAEDRYGPEENAFENKGRLYGEINQKPNKNFSYRFWAEYLPNFTNPNDYIITHEASITSILTSKFSLKFAYRGIYDDEPAIPGNKNYDYNYSTSFVARF